jgi:hypothetical protein
MYHRYNNSTKCHKCVRVQSRNKVEARSHRVPPDRVWNTCSLGVICLFIIERLNTVRVLFIHQDISRNNLAGSYSSPGSNCSSTNICNKKWDMSVG